MSPSKRKKKLPAKNKKSSAKKAAGVPEKIKKVRPAPADLNEHESLLSTLIGNMQDALIILSFDGTVLFANMAAARLVGIPNPEAGIGTNIAQFVDPVSLDKAVRDLTTIAQTGGPLLTELRLRKNDGSIVWAETMGVRIQYKGQGADLVTIRDISERKQIETALLTSEEKFSKTFQSSPDAILLTSVPDGKIIEINDSVLRITGYSPDEVLGCTTTGLDLWADPPAREEYMARIRSEGRVANFETVFRKKSGAIIVGLISGEIIHLRSGPCFISVIHDITERKRVDAALRTNMERLQYLLSSTSVAIYTSKTSGDYGATSITDNVKQITGYEPYEFIDNSRFWIDHVHPEDSQRILNELLSVFEKGSIVYEYRFLMKDGHYRWMRDDMRLITDTFNKPFEIIGYWVDINERKQAEETLRIVQEKYTKAFLAAPDAITISELDSGRFVEVNDAAFKIFGYSRDEMIGKSALELGILLNTKDRQALVDKVKARGRVVEYEIKEQRKSGEIFNASITADTFTIGNTTHLITIIHDITKRKLAEEALRESEERYSALFSNNYSVSLLIDPATGMIVDANDAASRYYGHSHDQLMAMGIFDLNRLPKDKVVQDLQRAKGGKAKHFFSSHYLASSEKRNVEVYSGPITVQGKPLFYSIIHDITDQKKAQQALKDSETQLNVILQGSPIPKFVIDTRHRIISWNKALEEISGIKAKEVLGTTRHWKAFYKNERPCMADLLLDGAIEKIPQLYKGKYKQSEVAEGGYEATDFFPDLGGTGKWLRFVAAPIKDLKGKIIGAVETLEDITELKDAEHSLRVSEERYRTLFDKLPEYVIVHRNGILLYVNPAAAEHLGYDNQALIGKPVTLFVEPEYHSLVKKAIMQRIAGDVVEPYEIRITTKDGSSHAILVNGAQVYYDGAPASLNVLTDITTIKKAEEVIRQANENLEKRVTERTEALSRSNIQLEAEIKARNAAEQEIHKSLGEKDLLLREIHHRVKNNLQIIASLLNLQSRTIKDQNVLDAIKDSQSRVRAMALVHERIYRSSNIGEIDLRDYIDYLVKQLFMFHNIPHAKVGITFTMEPVLSDIDTLVPIGLIINELVSNSLKHAFPGDRKGRITIEGTTVSPELLRFTYRDDGVGIPADVDWKKPTSLGLRLITSLVEQLSGEIALERDAGIKFVFTLHPKKPLKMPGADKKHD